MLKNSYVALLASLMLGVLFAVGVSASEDDSNPPGQGMARVTAIQPEAKESLEVFERGRSRLDALPDEYAERMGRRASFGMNPDLSRRAISNLARSIYVIPARDRVCASLASPLGVATTCPPTDDLARGEVGGATVALDTGVSVYGLVPDGVDSVSIETDEHRSMNVPTEANAYYTVIPLDDRVRSMSYVGPSGPVEFALADPRSAMREP